MVRAPATKCDFKPAGALPFGWVEISLGRQHCRADFRPLFQGNLEGDRLAGWAELARGDDSFHDIWSGQGIASPIQPDHEYSPDHDGDSEKNPISIPTHGGVTSRC